MEIQFSEVSTYIANLIQLNILYISDEILAKARNEDFNCKFFINILNENLYVLLKGIYYQVIIL